METCSCPYAHIHTYTQCITKNRSRSKQDKQASNPARRDRRSGGEKDMIQVGSLHKEHYPNLKPTRSEPQTSRPNPSPFHLNPFRYRHPFSSPNRNQPVGLGCCCCCCCFTKSSSIGGDRPCSLPTGLKSALLPPIQGVCSSRPCLAILTLVSEPPPPSA